MDGCDGWTFHPGRNRVLDMGDVDALASADLWKGEQAPEPRTSGRCDDLADAAKIGQCASGNWAVAHEDELAATVVRNRDQLANELKPVGAVTGELFAKRTRVDSNSDAHPIILIGRGEWHGSAPIDVLTY